MRSELEKKFIEIQTKLQENLLKPTRSNTKNI